MDPLLARILADPDDLATREVYADALADDPRGELIATACALAAAGVPTIDALVASDLTGEALARCVAQHRRAQQLHVTHFAAWRGSHARPPLEIRAMHDGFVTDLYASCDDDDSVAALGEVLAREPVRRLELLVDDDAVDAVARLPFGNLRQLNLRSAKAAAVTAAMPRLRSLRLEYVPDAAIVDAVSAPGLVELALRVEHQDAVDRVAARFGSRLTRLDLGGSRGLDARTLFDGRFANLEHLGLDIASVELEQLTGRWNWCIPASLDVADVRVDARGWSAIAAAGLRRLRATIEDAHDLAAILRAPLLESLALAKRPYLVTSDELGHLLASTPRRLRSLDLDYQEFTPATLAAVTHAHDLEALRIGGNDAGGLARAFADSPRAPHMRVLALKSYTLDDTSVRELVTAPTLRRLRKLVVAKTNLSVRGLRAIAAAGLDELVELDVTKNFVRIGPELHARPSLARVHVDAFGDERAHATFGSQRTTAPRLVVLVAEHHRVREVREALDASGMWSRDGNGYLEVDDSELRVHREADPACALAVADLAPDRADAIAARPWRIDLVPRSYQQAPSRDAARALARAFDGVVWDLTTDSIVDT